jgi:hypothetical protein
MDVRDRRGCHDPFDNRGQALPVKSGLCHGSMMPVEWLLASLAAS